MKVSPATVIRPLSLLIAVLVVGGWSAAVAGPLGSTPRAIGTGGPDAGYWRGSVDFQKAYFGNAVEATLDWAVFAPGDFQLFLNDVGVAASDPAPGEVVYAYQLDGVTTADPGIGSVSVGMDSAAFVGTLPTQVLTSWAGEQPISSAFLSGTTAAYWSFLDVGNDAALVDVGEISPLLVFGSPNAPQLDTFEVYSGVAGYDGNTLDPLTMVGSPGSDIYIDQENIVPEPATMVLLMVGIAGLALIRRRP